MKEQNNRGVHESIQMNFFYDFEIPAGRAEKDAYTEVLPLSYGVITKVQIIIPPGHAALAHLQLLYHESQLYPLNRGGNYKGNKAVIDFDEYQPILVAPYELKARGWNEDTKNVHSFLCSFTVLLPEEMGREIPSVSIKALEELIGEEVEIV